MVLFSQIGFNQRLYSHADTIQNNAELENAHDHCQRYRTRLTVAGGDMTDQYIIHDSPAKKDNRINNTVSHNKRYIGK